MGQVGIASQRSLSAKSFFMKSHKNRCIKVCVKKKCNIMIDIISTSDLDPIFLLQKI
jgi:hypothetical protein